MNATIQWIDIIGNRVTGIKFNGDCSNEFKTPGVHVKFCEAVIHSIKKPLIIKKEDIDCLGASRAFGYYKHDENFAREIAQETKIPFDFIRNAIKEIPKMEIPVENILLGRQDNPDVTIAFVKPYKITKLIFSYAAMLQEKPIISPYFFMSVCANIAVQTYLTNKICISYGCPESRKEGRVQNDEVIVGIPGTITYN